MNESCEAPLVTVVMPIYNEERFIEDTLMRVVKQDYPEERLEILVVDGMSTDSTRKLVLNIADKYSSIQLLDNPKKKSSSGRNIGFRSGKGEFFVVIDGHCYIPTDQLIKNIVKAFRETGADCLGRPQLLDPPGLSPFQKAVAVARASKIGHSASSHIYSDFEGFVSPTSNGAAYKREVFDRVGYVDEKFDAAEDLEFNYRVEKAGLKCFTSPSLMIKYYPRESLFELFHQLKRYGQGRYNFICKHTEVITFNQIVPFCFIVGLFFFILSFLGMVWSDLIYYYFLVNFFVYAIYFCIVIYFSIKESLLISDVSVYRLLLIYLVIHTSLGCGYLNGIFFHLRDKK